MKSSVDSGRYSLRHGRLLSPSCTSPNIPGNGPVAIHVTPSHEPPRDGPLGDRPQGTGTMGQEPGDRRQETGGRNPNDQAPMTNAGVRGHETGDSGGSPNDQAPMTNAGARRQGSGNNTSPTRQRGKRPFGAWIAVPRLRFGLVSWWQSNWGWCTIWQVSCTGSLAARRLRHFGRFAAARQAIIDKLVVSFQPRRFAGHRRRRPTIRGT